MIIRKEEIIGDKVFIHTYSDINHYITRDGILYEDCYDPIELKDERIYTESEEEIKQPEEGDLDG